MLSTSRARLRLVAVFLPVFSFASVLWADPPQLVVLRADADLSSGKILIQGMNFLTRSESELAVTLGGYPLSIEGIPTATEILADLPAGYPAGTYLLTVSRGPGRVKNDVFHFAIGAVGPPGPRGETGEAGPPGPPGPPGPDVTAQIAELQRLVADLRTRVAALEGKLAYVSVDGTNVVISGANLYVNSGAGTTDALPNGLGNVIIGYNELRGAGDDRRGSHNLIVGRGNNYASHGAIVGGFEATATAPYSIAFVGNQIALGSVNALALTTGTNFALTAGGNAVFNVGNSTTLTTGGALSASAGATLGLAANGNAVFDVGGSLALSVGAATTVTSGGPLSFTAPQIRLN